MLLLLMFLLFCLLTSLVFLNIRETEPSYVIKTPCLFFCQMFIRVSSVYSRLYSFTFRVLKFSLCNLITCCNLSVVVRILTNLRLVCFVVFHFIGSVSATPLFVCFLHLGTMK